MNKKQKRVYTSRKKTAPITLTTLKALIAFIDNQPKTITTIRNRAIILVGYFSALDPADLSEIDWEDVEIVKEGAFISIGKLDSDQKRIIAIPIYSDKTLCPVNALLDWQVASQRYSGAIFIRTGALNAMYPNIKMRKARIVQIVLQTARDAKLPIANKLTGASFRFSHLP